MTDVLVPRLTCSFWLSAGAALVVDHGGMFMAGFAGDAAVPVFPSFVGMSTLEVFKVSPGTGFSRVMLRRTSK